MNQEMLKIPNHVAIILDGNGRWATEKGKRRNQKLTLKTREDCLSVIDNMGKHSPYASFCLITDGDGKYHI